MVDGSITSTVQANTTAGFSIVQWTGTASQTLEQSDMDYRHQNGLLQKGQMEHKTGSFIINK